MTGTSNEQPVRWALIGSGEFALDWTLPALRAATGAEPIAVVTREPSALRLRRPDIADLAVTSSLAALVDLGVEIVHVITPNDRHLELTLETLQLGMNVLVEKPMALSVDDAQLMAQTADTTGQLLAVGSCMAWSPVLRRAQELTSAGALGTVVHAHMTAGFDARAKPGWRQLQPTAEGGGVLYDLGPHAIDGLIRLLGPVVLVSAHLSSTVDGFQSDDAASVMLQHESGCTSFVHLSFTHACNELTIAGTEGELTGRNWLGRRFEGELIYIRGQHGASDFSVELDGPTIEKQQLPFTDVMERQGVEVSKAVRARSVPVHASRIAGAEVVRVLQAAITSSLERREVAITPAVNVGAESV